MRNLEFLAEAFRCLVLGSLGTGKLLLKTQVSEDFA